MGLNNKNVLLNPLKKSRLHEGIVAQLKDKIIGREILPGEKLPPERQLAETLDVNRTTVREALNKLEDMELVAIKHGDGVYVRDYLESGSLDLVKHMLFKDGVLDIGIIKNLAHLRRILVPEIACQAALNRTDEDLAELERVIFKSDEMQIEEKDWRIHNIIARASGNLLSVILLNSFTGMLRDYAYLYFGDKKNVRRSEAFHRDIYKAIKENNPDKARKIILDVYAYAEEATNKRFNKYGKPRG